MSKTVVIVVNGILTMPGNAHAWTDRAVTWLHTHTEARAEKFEYLALPLTRRIMQRARARNLAELIDSYRNHDIHLVGHSNGCDLICRALKQIHVSVKSVHLIAAATDADFEKNGLNEALHMQRLGSVHIYGGESDLALEFAFATSHFLKWFGLGYGALGWIGPQNVADDDWYGKKIMTQFYPEFGHSTFFEHAVFPTIMRTISLAL